jgi:isopenicillin N synthase-like dioxygenase
LQYLDHNFVWRDMPVSARETVIIPDMQMQLVSDGQLTATCHRVEKQGDPLASRFSAVCFVRFKGVPEYDKATHGRLQEKESGFNYKGKMSPADFAKLFK